MLAFSPQARDKFKPAINRIRVACILALVAFIFFKAEKNSGYELITWCIGLVVAELIIEALIIFIYNAVQHWVELKINQRKQIIAALKKPETSKKPEPLKKAEPETSSDQDLEALSEEEKEILTRFAENGGGALELDPTKHAVGLLIRNGFLMNLEHYYPWRALFMLSASGSTHLKQMLEKQKTPR